MMVTNGTAELAILDELAPYIDAMNIDLKSFNESTYKEVLGGSLEQTASFIKRATEVCHVELTTLIVPGVNDGEEEMRELSKWVAVLKNPSGEGVPLHVTRFSRDFICRTEQRRTQALFIASQKSQERAWIMCMWVIADNGW